MELFLQANNIFHFISLATVIIEESLSLNNEELGVLGSLVYAGIVLVGFFIGKVFVLYNAKLILVAGYIGMVTSLFLFTL